MIWRGGGGVTCQTLTGQEVKRLSGGLIGSREDERSKHGA